MLRVCKLLAVLLVFVCCFGMASCALFGEPQKGNENTTETTTLLTTPEETTPEVTTPEETTPEATTPAETTPAVTEPDFSNVPDPDGTKRY